ncbi:hypothetical protein KBX39_03405 [Micromonospora sp. D75]|nr:hypothetical protein [Micromonospora sp. D75]
MRGYGGIEADIRQMREFADRLQDEVTRNYSPHLSYIADDMRAPVPNPADAFIELVHFLQAHHDTQTAAVSAVWDLAPATGRLADAAGRIANHYGDADAFSSARVTDVERALAGPSSTVARPLPPLADPTAPEQSRVILP